MGKTGGWSIQVNETSSTIDVEIRLKLAICDSTKEKKINLYQLGNAVEKQLKRSYQITYYKDTYNYSTIRSGLDYFGSRIAAQPVKKIVQVNLKVVSRIISTKSQIANDEHLLDLVENTGRFKLIYGRADDLGGSVVSLNAHYVNNIIKGLDNNTVPHEFGHTLGLLHVDKEATKSKDARQYWPNQKRWSKDSTNIMFDGRSRYMHGKTSISVIGSQIDIAIENYKKDKLNK